LIRPARAADWAQWLPLWQGYNAFYGRPDFDAAITRATWARFHDPAEPMHALVAERDHVLVGLAHCVFHRSTTMATHNCYLQDLFTAEAVRGQGIGRALIEAAYELARAAGSRRVYWQTHHSNPGRALYDRLGEHRGSIVYVKDFAQ
jgi:GNAT superfamily N-acetyltransferase